MSDFKTNAPNSISAGCIRYGYDGYNPRPRWGSIQRFPDPLAGFGGPTSKGRGGEEGWEGKGTGGAYASPK